MDCPFLGHWSTALAAIHTHKIPALSHHLLFASQAIIRRWPDLVAASPGLCGNSDDRRPANKTDSTPSLRVGQDADVERERGVHFLQ